ncbi:MAG: hypothetical protein R2824_32510 [Saprospiraceae bacterium]|nr:hypothetical protein [Lewinella sp.]
MILVLTALTTWSQEALKGAYGPNDLRIRASNGWIEESRLKNMDFTRSGLKNIAVIYWPDSLVDFRKIGVLALENKLKKDSMSLDLLEANQQFIREKFEQVSNVNFTVFDLPGRMSAYFKLNKVGAGMRIQEVGRKYLQAVANEGYDGLFIIFETGMPDLITGSKGALPSKGIFKFYKQEVVHYGLHSTLIDTKTGRFVRKVGYTQFSADYSAVPFPLKEELTSEQRAALTDLLRLRFENNIDEMIRVHKLVLKEVE